MVINGSRGAFSTRMLNNCIDIGVKISLFCIHCLFKSELQ